MARKRPTSSDQKPPQLKCIDGGKPDTGPPTLTRAEAGALARSAPVTYLQLKARLQPKPPPPGPLPPLRGL